MKTTEDLESCVSVNTARIIELDSVERFFPSVSSIPIDKISVVDPDLADSIGCVTELLLEMDGVIQSAKSVFRDVEGSLSEKGIECCAYISRFDCRSMFLFDARLPDGHCVRAYFSIDEFKGTSLLDISEKIHWLIASNLGVDFDCQHDGEGHICEREEDRNWPHCNGG